MNQKSEKYPVQHLLTAFQVVQMTCSSFLPLMFWIFPRVAVNEGGYDAQWSGLLLVFVGVLIGWVQGRLNHRFPEKTGIQYLSIVYGKWLGKFIGFVYVVIYTFFIAIGMRMFVFLVGALYMPHTPSLVLILLFLGVSVYGARLGVETLARISSMFNPPVILGLLTTFLAAVLEYPPFGLPSHIDRWDTLLNGTYYLMPMLFGFNLFQMLGPYYKKTKRSYLYPLVSIGVNGLLVIVALLVPLAMLGWEMVERVQWSLPFLFREIYLEGFIIERVGVSMIIISVVFNVLFTANHLWGLSVCWAQIFNKHRDEYRVFVFPTAFIVGIGAWAFRQERIMENIVRNYLTPLSWIVLIGIPVTTLFIAWIRKLGHPGPPESSKQKQANQKKNKKTIPQTG